MHTGLSQQTLMGFLKDSEFFTYLRKLTDRELLDCLGGSEAPLDQFSLVSLISKADSVESVVTLLCKDRKNCDQLETYWITFCVKELWLRWFPERLAVEHVDDFIYDAMRAELADDKRFACAKWEKGWLAIKQIMLRSNLKSIEEYYRKFPATIYDAFDCIEGYAFVLGLLGAVDSTFHWKRISFCKEVLTFMDGDGDDNSRVGMETMRHSIADSFFALGEREHANELYSAWLALDPQWGWGWIYWSSLFYDSEPPLKNLEKSEQIVRRGLMQKRLRNREDVLEHLALVLEETNKSDEAERVLKESKNLRKKAYQPYDCSRDISGDFLSDLFARVATLKQTQQRSFPYN